MLIDYLLLLFAGGLGAQPVRDAAPSQAPPAVAAPVPTPSGLDEPPPPALVLRPPGGLVRKRPNQVGVHVALESGIAASGSWQTRSGGRRIWRAAVQSPGAASLRVHFHSFDAGSGRVFVYSPESRELIAGPYAGRGPGANGEFWAGVTEGDVAVIEYEPAPGAGDALPFGVDRVAHAAPEPEADALGKESDRAVATCHQDVTCFGPWAESARAVARLRYETSEGSFACTGFLVATRARTNLPYLLTASHCVPNAQIAATVAAVWNYRAAACNGTAPAVPPNQSVGATLLATRPAGELDFSLLLLPSAPTNAFFLGWSLTKPTANATLTAIGHPDGSYQRLSTAELGPSTAGDKFEVMLTAGAVEPGSGGSPWMAFPGVVNGIHARDNADRFPDACRARAFGQLHGGGEWFSAIYPYVASYLDDSSSCVYSLSALSQSFPAAGGAATIAVRTRPGCAWTATSSAPWLTIGSGAAGSGEGAVSFSADANSNISPRSATVVIGGQELAVSQAAPGFCQPGTIAVGATVSANLASCSSALRPGRTAARFTFSGNAGDRVIVETRTSSFDSYLYLFSPTGASLLEDDDGGTGTNSRIPRDRGSLALPLTGTYTIEVSSYGTGESGSFLLSLSAGQGCAIQTIAAGQSVSGDLAATDCLSVDSNTFSDYYTFPATAGAQVAITMTAPVLDAFLILTGPDGRVLAEDDDSGGGLNARIGLFTLPLTGTYTIETTSVVPQAGSYVLRLETDSTGPPPTGSGPFRLVAITPCRVMDTRPGEGKSGAFGVPALAPGGTRDVPMPQSTCGIPNNARAYSLNVTVVPRRTLSYLTLWPTGQPRPFVSTLNSFDGRVVANAATVPAGAAGAISVFATDETEVIIDVNGYYVQAQ